MWARGTHGYCEGRQQRGAPATEAKHHSNIGTEYRYFNGPMWVSVAEGPRSRCQETMPWDFNEFPRVVVSSSARQCREAGKISTIPSIPNIPSAFPSLNSTRHIPQIYSTRQPAQSPSQTPSPRTYQTSGYIPSRQ